MAWAQRAPSLTQAPPRDLPRVPGQQPVSPGVPSEPSAQRLWPREAQGEPCTAPADPPRGRGPSSRTQRDVCRPPSGPVLPAVTVLQVLKILLHLCAHGSASSLLILKRNPAFIQEAAGTGGRGKGSQGPPHAAQVFSPAPQLPPSLSHAFLFWPSQLCPPHGAEWPVSARVPGHALVAQSCPACSGAWHTTEDQQASALPPGVSGSVSSPGPRTESTVSFCFRRSVGGHGGGGALACRGLNACLTPTPAQAGGCPLSCSLTRIWGDDPGLRPSPPLRQESWVVLGTQTPAHSLNES